MSERRQGDFEQLDWITYPPGLVGNNVELDRKRGPLAPCPACGSVVGNIRPSVPRMVRIRCNGCDQSLGRVWVSAFQQTGATAA